MKVLILVLGVIIGCLADDKPGTCPDVIQNGAEACETDFDCQGLDKCCNQQCAAPVCDDDAPVRCLANPCDFANCSVVPEAQCYPDPCSDDCGVIWLAPEGDVTDICEEESLEEDEDFQILIDDPFDVDEDEDEIDDDLLEEEDEDVDEDSDERDMTKGDRKAWRKNKRQKWLKKKLAKKQKKQENKEDKTAKREIWLAKIQEKRDKKLSRWNAKGKLEKIAKFEEKWAAKDEKKANKFAEKKEKWQEKRQMIKEMSPEERRAFWADKKAKKMEKMKMKVERIKQRKGAGGKKWRRGRE